MALGQAKVSLLLACLRKLILLIPLIFILPLFIENKVLAVFLAEPVSDILAATVTVTVFSLRFHKILKRRCLLWNEMNGDPAQRLPAGSANPEKREACSAKSCWASLP